MRILALFWISLLYLPVLMVSGIFSPYLSRGPVITLICAAVSASAVFFGSFARAVFCRTAKTDTKIMFYNFSVLSTDNYLPDNYCCLFPDVRLFSHSDNSLP